MKKITKSILLLSALCTFSCALVFAGCRGEGTKTNLKDFPVDGGVYTGTCTSDGTPTGTGTIEYDNGNVYEGPVKDGKPEGEGVMIDAVTQATYTGAFVGGLYNDDEAVLQFDNGGIYTGAFENGKMKGEGKFAWPDSSVFEGTFSGAAGAEGSAGSLDATGTLAFVGGIDFVGSIVEGSPNEGSFKWPNNGPIYTGTFTKFLTGYGDLDMRNGIHYYGPMGGGLLVPVDAWTELDEEVVITYPDNQDYDGEVFRGAYVFNESENKDELIGTVTYADGVTVIENVKVMLDFSFSYRYTGTLTVDGVVYEGGLRDHGVPYGAGVYTWPNNGPTFTAVENHGWLTGYGTLDMKNGITYTGPLNAIAMAAEGGNEFKPYQTIAGEIIDSVTVVHPAGIFTGKLELFGLEKITDAAVKAFYSNATYLSVGKFKDVNNNDVDFLFVPSFAFGLYPIMETNGTSVDVGELKYEGRYTIINGLNFAFGEGQLYWTEKDAKPYLASDFFFLNTTGIVTFVQVGYKYVGGMTEGFVFGSAGGSADAVVYFDDGRVFNGTWVDGILTGTITNADGTTENGTIAITTSSCEFIKGE